MPTIVELLLEAGELANAQREFEQPDGGKSAREFALACTAIEDAVMRVNRGFAIRQGRFSPADVEAGAAWPGERPAP